MTTRVLVVDDDELVRRGISDWLEASGLEVVGTAENANECLKLVCEVKPDIAVVDILLPGVSGIELVRQLAQEAPETKSLVLSGAATCELVFEAYEAGARGYLPKQSSSEELSYAISQVLEGKWYLSPFVAEIVLKHICDIRGELTSRGEEGVELVGRAKLS